MRGALKAATSALGKPFLLPHRSLTCRSQLTRKPSCSFSSSSTAAAHVRLLVKPGRSKCVHHQAAAGEGVLLGDVADDVARVLFDKQRLAARVKEMAAEIERDARASNERLLLLGILTGAFVFLSDLIRALRVPHDVAVTRASSYLGASTASSGTVALSGIDDVTGRHVVVVEDIVDTGRTMAALVAALAERGAESVSVAVLLDKAERREVDFRPHGVHGKLYVGFQCPDDFVVGYGLDYDNRYRSLPFVGVLKPEALQ
eukprot:jgi/Chlat1/5204/Chrsp33S05175